MLNFMDIVILSMPLAGAILAVLKDTYKEEKSDTDKEEKPRGKKKITPLGVAALSLAAIGCGLSLASTYQTKKEANQRAQLENLFKDYIRKALNTELPGFISRATKELNESISATVNDSKLNLEDAINTTTQKSKTEVQSAIQQSGKAVASKLDIAINKSQEKIKATVGTTEREINKTIKNAQTDISEAVQESDSEIRASVTRAVDHSSYTITDVISQAVEAQTRRIGVMAERAVGEQIMQIPLRIDQYQSGRLGGPLHDIIVEVGDISKTKPFNIRVYQENGPILYNEDIKRGEKKGEWRKILFRHPGTGKAYQLEVTIQTQHNLLGTGLDYVVIRAINALSI